MSILSDWLLKFQRFECAVIGEYIRDEYITVIPRGLTQNLRTYERIGIESWDGGCLLVASHLSALQAQVKIYPYPTIHKCRYMTPDGHRLFSIASKTVSEFCISQAVPAEKCIICTDYGHGAFDQDYIDSLCASNKFIALTIQANSLNCKQNILTKWPRADYVLINLEELLLCNEEHFLIPALIKHLADRLKTKLFIVTRGAKGLWAYNEGRMWEQKALAQNVIDTLGAGDTFLAVTTPLVIMGAPIETILQIGSVAAGLHCSKRGNPALSKEELFESL